MHSIAIFGGTFDPVHNGHIKTSLAIQANFGFDSYYFLPCKSPAIKPPSFASSEQRVEMLKLALKPYPDFKIDTRELDRDTPSYMVYTLQSFRQEYTDSSLTLIIGYDGLLTLPQWYQWEKIIFLANLLVINREEFFQQPVPKSVQTLLNQYRNDDKNILLNHHAGSICLYNAGHYDISSTKIREQLKQHKDVKNNLPDLVYDYIKKQGLYQ
ncbi:TPA: nicotinate-nucleotide adenylyltransferase [Legionella pneumophila subsp. pneumophila]|uniref:nicotinate-nucleotide adenylyltransferase n=1 Tax=Legionella pneumophila TaxID=446 RepID=UPI0004948014|nr:nicotinate-nucleotide adenylyltransferase [Legionella pneumophila]HAT9489893.1 nicotinate-nucleotide adenylyltransferase [Legionella pneumophila subsp. pneumophila]MCZ4705896.1 nicotinate-nucleotide adenylyltransferase [Legionella pneumophila]MCZ4715583.1 nicotinate-nucleotide adenylyltransferase [Legionella pneumophila]HAT1885982.1 nicotinate-nucleotide adenylyltransferase [Legionella pneumophila]HAT1887831.1 nicotinate-nucleotide adenylyltransferase [Legionella pneumophila]